MEATSPTDNDMDALTRALQHPDLSRLVARLESRVSVDAEPYHGAQFAAVAAVLRVVEQPELLFIKRAEMERDPWSGHVAFPGGRQEPSDSSLVDTAVRETQEELSLDLHEGMLVGRLDDLSPRSPSLPPIIVRPFVAVVKPDVTLEPSLEVASTFWVPLQILRAPDTQGEHEMTVNGVRARFPAYRLDEHIIWGLTERIVRQLLGLF